MVDWNELVIGFEYQPKVSEFHILGSMEEWKDWNGGMTYYIFMHLNSGGQVGAGVPLLWSIRM